MLLLAKNYMGLRILVTIQQFLIELEKLYFITFGQIRILFQNGCCRPTRNGWALVCQSTAISKSKFHRAELTTPHPSLSLPK